MSRADVRRITAATFLTTAALVLAACAAPLGGAPSPTPTATPDPMDDACAEALVIACERGGGSTVVIIAGDTPEEAVLDYAPSLYAAASASPDTVTLRSQDSDAAVLDPEVAAPARWEVSAEAESVEEFTASLSEAFVAMAVPGATGFLVTDGWPSVTVETIERFDDVFTQLSSTSQFRSGGTYTLQSLDEHLRIVHIPDRTADEAILEIVDIARTYPHAEVLLEAPTSGPQYPKLHVSRLTPAEVQEVDARLRESRLADADVDGYPLEYVLGSLGEQGTTFTVGTFGDVPSG